MRHQLSFILNSFLNSYSQIFFSKNKIFGLLLLIVSFFDVYSGLAGVIAIFTSVSLSLLLGFNRSNIQNGYYSFNNVFIGLALGVSYNFNVQFVFFLIFASILTLFFTITIENILEKYLLPYLSFPFMISIWLVVLSGHEFKSLEISDRGIYVLNDLYGIGGIQAVSLYEQINNLAIPIPIITYFKSLGAILFQYNIIAGVIIAIGLLIHSRIAFLLSIVGFFFTYNYYKFIGADITHLNYLYIGFNFILTSIAIGSFFTIPNIILFIPITSIILSGFSSLLSIFGLPIYSMPFNMAVLLFLFVLRSGHSNKFIKIPHIQLYSPEQNLYNYVNNSKRFNNFFYAPIDFPFFGEWKISQGNNGNHTHKGDWQYALDFNIVDNTDNQFKGEGLVLDDYYCYNKPVLAPIDGLVIEIIDSVKDNNIGDVNIEENWGNAVIIKYSESLYASLNHLRTDKIKVKVGDIVKKGNIIGYVGNSGRSPYPHLHFQLQKYPHIGSETIYYPIANYIVKTDNKYTLKLFDIPKENETVMNIVSDSSMIKAYNFTPGQKLIVLSTNKVNLEWEILTDAYNNTYIYCRETNSSAYFINTDNIFMFTSFYGNKKSHLFYFFLANYKILKSFYQDIEYDDSLPLTLFNNKIMLMLQDIFAPFYIFTKSKYQCKYNQCEKYLNNSKINMESSITVKILGNTLKKINFKIGIIDNKINYSYILNKTLYSFIIDNK